MKELDLKAATKTKKYKSYRGETGKTVENLVAREFVSGKPYTKMGTDVTQFRISSGKLYLSPIIDFYTREILSYDVSEHPNFKQIKNMLNKLVKEHGENIKGGILHSDQGWQYQMKYYHLFLLKHGMVQSMSRKGNCLDNSPTENFFGRMKEEMFYGNELNFTTIEELREAIKRYIEYYNNERLITRLRMKPTECRKEYYLHHMGSSY